VIEIVLNGEVVQSETDSLVTLLEQRFSESDKFAVAINEMFIPKASYSERQLQNGDKVELVMPMSGG